LNVASLKTLPGKPNWDKTMVKEKSTTRIFLPLIKTLLDISETMHSNLISQLLKYWCWQSLVNKFTRYHLNRSLNVYLTILLKIMCEKYFWWNMFCLTSFDCILPSIELYIIFVYGGWNILCQRKITYFLNMIDHDSNHTHSRLTS